MMFVECRSSIDVHPQVATLGVMRRLILRRDDVNCDNASLKPETKHDVHDTVTARYTMKYRKLPKMKICRKYCAVVTAAVFRWMPGIHLDSYGMG